jgi:hypothetical protein
LSSCITHLPRDGKESGEAEEVVVVAEKARGGKEKRQ